MKTKKIVRYRLSVSRYFPKEHKKAGEQTFFAEKILSAIEKIHTIRGNYQLWEKRFEKINLGEAVLELYYWSGKPYNSKCITICQLSKDNGIGIQELEFLGENIFDAVVWNAENKPHVGISELSKNDGLSFDDFEEWFKNCDLSKSLAIIHFTKFRY